MARQKKSEVYLPLLLLKEMATLYPGVWDKMELLHRDKGRNGLPDWEDWCYAPIAAALAIVSMGQPDTFDSRLGVMRDAQRIAALAPWRYSKEVFVMDEGMQELLFDQADELELDPAVLLRLPYPSFYIQFAPGTGVNGQEYHGVFVHLENDPETRNRELRLLYLLPNGGTVGVPVYIDCKTMEESIERVSAEAHRNVPEDRPEVRRALLEETETRRQRTHFYKQTLQLVLYLCAENAEVAPNSEQAFFTRRTAAVKDRYAEIRKWDVGVRIGNAVRAYRKNGPQREGSEGSHASPRPHMRRGHWHNYWMGGRDDRENRKLVLKWLAPMFINADTEEAPVTLHPVKKPEE